jgi:hypothetical protein
MPAAAALARGKKARIPKNKAIKKLAESTEQLKLGGLAW